MSILTHLSILLVSVVRLHFPQRSIMVMQDICVYKACKRWHACLHGGWLKQPIFWFLHAQVNLPSWLLIPAQTDSHHDSSMLHILQAPEMFEGKRISEKVGLVISIMWASVSGCMLRKSFTSRDKATVACWEDEEVA